ncbi:unnamed protein product [Darwinula stevensoni]|uniref:Activator of Hsp90 ATPase AHSA1-like N-terminal domain-containing protein n=1 Tax=Darwinula stevensoni TaxID=69355 RepID=A0A7R8X7H1_9CRUS|nr:unnamed protein product [Darwinula stevensoni]CAG0886910.1 unnamed protein product [Darwinula stevensoni]
MAKWGQGDPRWIVEERPDATNVNNWHWTEKNASGWSTEKLRSLLVGMIVEDPHIGVCKITDIEKCEGEASANNRKAKVILFYEWDLKLKWEGKANGSDFQVLGKIDIPNLSDENEPGDVDVSVRIKSSGPESEKLKGMMRTKGAQLIREQLSKYIKDFQEDLLEFPILEISAVNAGTQEHAKNTSQMERLEIGGVRINIGDLELQVNLKCTAEEIYRVLTLKEMVEAFTRGPAIMDSEATKGSKFAILGGNISGEYLDLIPAKKVVQSWRFKSWPEEHYSTVTMKLKQLESSTDVLIKQTGVPIIDLERTKDGWTHHYFDAIKRTFGFGAFLL